MQLWRIPLARKRRMSMLAPIYRLYERRLLREVRALPVPRHIGLILDGNRRFARQNKLRHPDDIYRVGADKLDDLIDWCIELEIPSITLWVFSTENRKRPSEEVTGILAAVETKLKFLASDNHFHSRHVRVRAVGRLELLPTSTLAAVRAAEDATKDYTGMQPTLAAAYGGREEIVDAVRGLLQQQLAQAKTLEETIDLVTPEAIGQFLYAPDMQDPDLIIRTSGEIRLSGFLLWQSVFSEFYFTDVYWPAFRRIDFLRALRAFQHRQRRFGK
jgi:short-chain Z-isoprenyl diphosphate synthase